jgi:hypothetical protein
LLCKGTRLDALVWVPAVVGQLTQDTAVASSSAAGTQLGLQDLATQSLVHADDGVREGSRAARHWPRAKGKANVVRSTAVDARTHTQGKRST